MASILDPTALARFGRLAFLARNLVEGFLQGLHKSPFKGFSVEFAEHRQYYPGDEIRHIDWRAFGKTDRYYIKEFEEETNLQAHLLLDASGSMAYRGEGPSKFEYAQLLAASLSYLMLHQLDAVGLMVHDEHPRRHLPPHANAKHLLRILDALHHAKPRGESSLARIWDTFALKLQRRGLVILLSDCFDGLPQLLAALKHFRFRGQEVLLFHILAPEEIEFPFHRPAQFRSLENTGRTLEVDARHIRAEYLKKFQGFCDQLKMQAGLMQVDYHLMRTDQPIERALGIYLHQRLARK